MVLNHDKIEVENLVPHSFVNDDVFGANAINVVDVETDQSHFSYGQYLYVTKFIRS